MGKRYMAAKASNVNQKTFVAELHLIGTTKLS